MGGDGFGMFDHILYINLDKRTDRRWQLECELRKMGVPDSKITRISGVIDRFGSLGCSKAHLAALTLFEQHPDWENVLIMEDDAMFSQSREQIDSVLNQFCSLHIKWDVLQLLANVQEFRETTFPGIVRFVETQTTACYAVNKTFLSILKSNVAEGISKLEKCENSQSDFCIDQYWKPLQKAHTWLGFTPVIGYQRDGYSDIEQRVTNYNDKVSLTTSYNPDDFLLVIKGTASFQPANLKYFCYIADENLQQDYEFDIDTRVLKVRCKDDELNNCCKFGQMLRFLRNVLVACPSTKGAFFVENVSLSENQQLLADLRNNSKFEYWGTVESVKAASMRVANFETSVPNGLEYCPFRSGFYLSNDTIFKLLRRNDLFLSFPSADRLEFHYNSSRVLENVCVWEDINVAEALRSFQVFPKSEKLFNL
jgi:hypothetical protein